MFEGGLGVKTLGRPDPVDADTLFLAASNTKAMTTLLLAELVDEKQVALGPAGDGGLSGASDWADAETTRQVLVKHLLCACTGLPRQDFEWLFNYATATPASSLASLAAMQPTSRFGEVYQYSNVMAGRRRLCRRIAGRSRTGARRRLRRGHAVQGVRTARHDAHDLRLSRPP